MAPARRWLVALAAVVVLALASHGPAFDAEFIRFDDTAYVQVTPHVASGLRLENVRWALTGYAVANWHPVTWISHMIDVELFGFEPRGHHAVNLALHALNVAILFFLLRSLTGDPLPSLLVAGVFAVHPANVESVAWIAQRKTLLSTLFAMLSIAAYVRWVRGGQRRDYATSLGLAALSLMSKPMFVTLPFGLLLLDYWPLRRAPFEPAAGRDVTLGTLVRGWWRLFPEKIPYLVLCGAVAVITMDAQRDSMTALELYPASQRLGNVALSYVKYVATFFAPYRLAAFYPLYPEGLTPPVVLACLTLLGMLTLALGRLGLRHRYLLVGWLWFLGMLVPVIGLVQVGMQSAADRYVYVPFWGLSIALAWSLRDLLRAPLQRPAVRIAVGLAIAALLGSLGILTHRYAEKWHDAIRLFQHAIAVTDGNWLAHGLLAERYYAGGDFDKTIEHSLEAIKYNRSMGTVRSTYGLALYAQGKADLAREQFQLAAEQEPDNPIGFMHLGWLHVERGEHDLAIAVLADAADRISRTTLPYTQKTIYANWATALAQKNQLGAAREKYELALAIEPDSLDLLRDAARVDVQLDDLARAAERLRHALEVAPADPDAAHLLASVTALQGGESAALFARAQALDPRRGVVSVDLARSLASQRRYTEANELLRLLLALEPAADPAAAQFVASAVQTQLGEIALAQGDLAASIDALDRALAIWPENYDAKHRLAFLLATSADPTLRDPRRAVELAERASAERREFASLSTLAAAYASAGRMPAAVDAARQGLELASQANDARAIGALQRQIDLYLRADATVRDSTPQ